MFPSKSSRNSVSFKPIDFISNNNISWNKMVLFYKILHVCTQHYHFIISCIPCCFVSLMCTVGKLDHTDRVGIETYVGNDREELPPIKVIRERCINQLGQMRPDHMRRLNPTPYKVCSAKYTSNCTSDLVV